MFIINFEINLSLIAIILRYFLYFYIFLKVGSLVFFTEGSKPILYFAILRFCTALENNSFKYFTHLLSVFTKFYQIFIIFSEIVLAWGERFYGFTERFLLVTHLYLNSYNTFFDFSIISLLHVQTSIPIISILKEVIKHCRSSHHCLRELFNKKMNLIVWNILLPS